MKPKKIGVTGLKQNSLAKETARIAIKLFEEKNFPIEIDKNFLGRGKRLTEFNCDLILSFGGDGTLLQTFRLLKKQIPVMGINCGNLGFLQAFSHNEIEFALKNIIKGKFAVEKRARVSARVDGKKIGEALNEALIVSGYPGRITKYTLKIGAEEREEAGDGLIVATPTGSTAHSLSAGGPIIKGNAKVFAIVSINPVDWKHRPLIINDHEKIIVDDFSNSKAKLILDGQKTFSVKKKVEFEKGTDILLVVN